MAKKLTKVNLSAIMICMKIYGINILKKLYFGKSKHLIAWEESKQWQGG